jgi:hypothetical protein
MRSLVATASVAACLLAPVSGSSHAAPPRTLAIRALNGSGNNLRHPNWGAAGIPYLRVAAPNYADGIGRMVSGPNARYISNRIFNDLGQNLFSENDVSQLGWTWAQFIDHTIGLRDETPGESAPIAFDAQDHLERFRDDLGSIPFARTPAAPGTGVTSPRQQINTVNSYIDAWNVYGGSEQRLAWLRDGARLLLPGGYLPTRDARGDASSAPVMDIFGAQTGGADTIVAGDVRANENMALTAMQTLFAREHDRIVSLLPRSLPTEARFQIARRVVGAEEQYITYTQFLPALGVRLAPYTGYKPDVNPGATDEFATVGFRGHSMIHGEIEPLAAAGRYTVAQLDAFRAEGVAVEPQGARVKLSIPLDLAFGNPALLRVVGLGPTLAGLAGEREYRNDEQIDNQLRSVLFEVPKPGATDPNACLDGPSPSCFDGVVDLAAIDIQRGRDHGMPLYNAMRRAYGLAPKRSFTAITGESTDTFPAGLGIDSPAILDFTQLRDADGKVVPLGSAQAEEDAVTGTRRTTLAARLRAIYGSVDRVDAFVGMMSEAHVPRTEFGELQLAMWKKQFEALRDGDRFFYGNDPYLDTIRRTYGIDYRQTLGTLIERDAGVRVQREVFKAPA